MIGTGLNAAAMPQGSGASPAAGKNARAWSLALQAAAIFAIDPAGLGGVALRAPAGPVRERWLSLLRALLPASAPLRTIPLHCPPSRLLGGLDLVATLRDGRPVAETGLLAAAEGGVVVVSMAERASATTAALLAGCLDGVGIAVEREGVSARIPGRFGVIVLDEGEGPEERPAEALQDRLAFHLDLSEIGVRDCEAALPMAAQITEARALLPRVASGDETAEALTAAAAAFAIPSLRAPLLALKAARAIAALNGQYHVDGDAAAAAAALVLAPRARALPADADGAEEQPPEPPPESNRPDDTSQNDKDDRAGNDQDLAEMVIAATAAALPPGLLASLGAAMVGRSAAASAGRVGAERNDRQRGRPVGSVAGEPRDGNRIALLETLRAAAPWQAFRRKMTGLEVTSAAHRRLIVRREDLRIRRMRRRSETVTVFAVDASGSAALHRLAEAKGAVELLLADCYARRDFVSVIAFRGGHAEVLLPPTRALVRAKRSLSGLPGGGGTPLAAGIDAASALATAERRKGRLPVLVLLTDGRANVARDGRGGRAQAEADALAAAVVVRVAAIPAILIDTAPQPHPAAARLAEAMAARYLPLPRIDSAGMSKIVRAYLDASRG